MSANLDPSDASASAKDVSVGFVGAGRLGTGLAWALSAAGVPVRAIASRSESSARRAALGVPGCEVMSAQQVVDVCDLTFVCTPDQAIGPTVDALTWRAGVAVVHCSGATEVSVMHKAFNEGAQLGGFHPLQTFVDPAAAVRSLPGCTITIEASGPLHDQLVALAHRLKCRVNRLPAGARGRYHAAAGYASQFVNVLLREAAQIWGSWGASEEDAVAALLPLVRGTLASIEGSGLAGGMPGPVSRGDVASVARHVESLQTLPPDVGHLYRELCLRSICLARARGSLDAEQEAQLRALLRPKS